MVDSTNASVGCTAGTGMVASAAVKRFAVGGDHDRRGPVRPVDRHLLGHVVGVRALQAAAQTTISGSADRSMCFLSSVASEAIDL